MSGVRKFRREDVGGVANLWVKAFHRREGGASELLKHYFAEIFFDGPLCDESMPSFVCEDGGRGIVGFLGVLPRTMSFNGRPVKVAIATQLMVDADAYGTFAAAKLMRAFFAGPQELSLSDGANQAAQRLWQAGGGDVVLPDSLSWTRILRPAQYALVLLRRVDRLLSFARALRPFCQAVDAAVGHSRLGRYYFLPETSGTGVEEEPADETLLWCIRNFAGDRALHPAYELEGFRWLLRMASEKQMFGAMRKGVVRDADRQILGWYLYYAREGGIGQVLQFGGRPNCIRLVLNHLFHDAWTQGAVALSGKLEPRFAKELAQCRCTFTFPGYGVLVQSGNKEIVSAIHQGSAFLTRLDGEWWARFSDPGWLVPSGASAGGVVDLTEAPHLRAAH